METIIAKFEKEKTLSTIRGHRSVHFRNKENRDEVFRILKAEGIKNIKKSSIRNQQLHPEYLEDYEGSYETGFGNTNYQMMWRNLYNIEVIKNEF